ncbi:hypothetical protein J2X72_001575 [Phyllobacterium sp. 1468]|uniref:BA14K family protein n=1 Tax=Phyllobacterium sp. 1468 TaxID=2817759 RepID=UPI001AE19A50|nr:hypothetical protein [Phyllobacterium sp. 1468]
MLAALAMSAGLTSVGPIPAFSAPLAPLSIETTSANVEQVQYRRHYRGDRNWNGNRYYRGDRYYRGGRYYGGDRYWYRGHRGYNYYRPGYRYYNGAWFPLAAFGTGVIVGSAIAPRPVYRTGSAHTQWCYNRYRSYRAYDNTYQPNNGPRRQCVSPY